MLEGGIFVVPADPVFAIPTAWPRLACIGWRMPEMPKANRHKRVNKVHCSASIALPAVITNWEKASVVWVRSASARVVWLEDSTEANEKETESHRDRREIRRRRCLRCFAMALPFPPSLRLRSNAIAKKRPIIKRRPAAAIRLGINLAWSLSPIDTKPAWVLGWIVGDAPIDCRKEPMSIPTLDWQVRRLSAIAQMPIQTLARKRGTLL